MVLVLEALSPWVKRSIPSFFAHRRAASWIESSLSLEQGFGYNLSKKSTGLDSFLFQRSLSMERARIFPSFPLTATIAFFPSKGYARRHLFKFTLPSILWQLPETSEPARKRSSQSLQNCTFSKEELLGEALKVLASPFKSLPSSKVDSKGVMHSILFICSSFVIEGSSISSMQSFCAWFILINDPSSFFSSTVPDRIFSWLSLIT